MIIATTPPVEGRRIAPCQGLVTDEAAPGASILRDIAGSRAASCGLEEARAPGVNAAVGVDLDCEVINNLLMVSASGTAVTIA
ncbi:MAG: heavy metal-binding domain-containing protein [Gemmobacter sp.]|jgi:uncharacterized protein YbjQ (UPF0145 family)|nr:heavy metal-binding domain-containing protein [Gemmobacter sp.]